MIQKELSIGWTLPEITARLDIYTKAQLDGHLGTYVKSFHKGEREWLYKQEERIVEVVEQVEFIISAKKTNKGSLLKYYALPFLNPACFQRFVTYLPEEAQTLLTYIVLNGIIESTTIKAVFGFNATTKGRTPDWRNQYPIVEVPSLKLFSNIDRERYGMYSHYHNTQPIKYSLPGGVRELMAALLFPEPPPITFYEPQTDNEKQKIISTEQIVLQELPSLLIRLQQKPLKLTQKGRPSVASVRSIGKKLKIQEFYPENEHADLKNIRVNALVGLLGLRKKQDQNNTVELIKKLFEQEFTTTFHIPIHLMGYIKGVGRIDSYYLQNCNAGYKELMRKLPPATWISYDSIAHSLKTQQIMLSPIGNNGMYNLMLEFIDPEEEERYLRSKSLKISPYWIEKLIIWPAFQAALFVMASWGLIDMIYEEPDLRIITRTADSPYDGIKAIRINDLGAYVLGITSTYTSQIKAPFTLELAQDSLTILLTDGDYERAALAISSFAAPLGNKRFYTDSKLFLGDCKTPDDLKHKINIFKTVFSDPLPGHWDTFFKEISLKVNPLEEEKSFVVFRLDHDNRSLLQLIVRDEKLKQMCLKAEGYLILVQKKDINKFKKRLQEYGYLLE